MYLSVTDVKVMDNYQLLLTFENKEKRLFDMTPYLNLGIFKPLKDKNLFKTVKISFDTIEWSNGADIDPETLYSNSKTINI